MSKVFFAAVASAAVLTAQPSSARTIFPKPLRQTDDASALDLPIDQTNFQFSAAKSSPTNDILENAFNRYYAIALGQSAGSNENIVDAASRTVTGLEVTLDTGDTSLTLETNVSYTLKVSAPTITLSAQNVYGAMNGLESFSQLVGSHGTINGTYIEDNPRYQFRATM